MKTASLISEAFFDLYLQLAPPFLINQKQEYHYAFLVHPRNFSDIYRKYPALKAVPKNWLYFFSQNFWPVVVSRITGLKNQKDDSEVSGYVITIAMTAEQMLLDRPRAVKRIKQALKLASRKGARIVGLGALTASVTRGGLDLADNPYGIAVTTGHAYTAHNITEYVRTVQADTDISREDMRIAIVGAAGSVGSTCAQVLARDGFGSITLIDIERKKERFNKLPDTLRALNPLVDVSISHVIHDARKAHVIITATNAPEAVVTSRDVSPGTVIVDDAQPSDVAAEVFERDDVVVLEAGAVHTSGITTNFNMGLQDRYDNFCCMAELLVLASKEYATHYVLDRATLALVDEMATEGQRLGFHIARFQNDREFISDSRMNTVRTLMKQRH